MMKKPTLKEFGLSEAILNQYKIYKENRENVSHFVFLICMGIACIIGVYYFYTLTTSLLDAVIIGTIIGAVSGVIPSALISLLIPLFVGRSFRYWSNVKKYEKAYSIYSEWFERQSIEFWLHLNGREFEVEIATLYQKLGYNVKLTPLSGDMGVDLYIEKGGKKQIVQCKAHKKPIGVGAVRDLYGTMNHYNILSSVLISRGGFTSGVIEFCKNKPIELLTLDRVIRMHLSVEEKYSDIRIIN